MAVTADQVRQTFDLVMSLGSSVVKLTKTDVDDKILAQIADVRNYPGIFDLAAFLINKMNPDAVVTHPTP